ncbi:hypothetical protein [Streptomyces sp. NPDC055134]
MTKQGDIPGAQACDFATETLLCQGRNGITARDPVNMEQMWTAAQGWDLYIPPEGAPAHRIMVVQWDSNLHATAIGEITQGDGTLVRKGDLPNDADLRTMSGGFMYLTSTQQGDVTRLVQINRRTGATQSMEFGVPEELLGIIGDTAYSLHSSVVTELVVVVSSV